MSICMTRTTQVGKLEDAYLQGKLFYIISGAKHMMPRKPIFLFGGLQILTLAVLH